VHLLLTDRLTCPRCGPGFGLILLADRLVERRVHAGSLGCPNCRDRFPIEDGFADLRPPPRGPLDDVGVPPEPTAAATEQLAALLGVAHAPGNVGLLGALAAHADALADRIAGVEVVAIAGAARAHAEREGVSRLVTGPEPPFHPWTFRALASADASAPVEALVRLVARGGRIVLAHPEPGADARLERARARILLRQPDWIVAAVETA
jgi:uncharacterized protein YbaR (Trm112 family)